MRSCYVQEGEWISPILFKPYLKIFADFPCCAWQRTVFINFLFFLFFIVLDVLFPFKEPLSVLR